MYFLENPFFVLNISCRVDRRAIVAACEEKEFILGSEICMNAQNNLLNPKKRLTAEMGWFIDADDAKIKDICECLEKGEDIPMDGLVGLSRYNATIYNFSVTPLTDRNEITRNILNIDQQFSGLNVSAITDVINKCHQDAKIAEVQCRDVEKELSKQRELIRTMISRKLEEVSQDEYVELVTMIAEKCFSDQNYEDGIVVSDLIDQYEIRMQSELENRENVVNEHIQRIKRNISDFEIRSTIDSLITEVKDWDKLAQPIQLKSQSSGIPHENSERLGNELRNLSVYLHNEKNLSKEALKLADAMKSVFAELGGLLDAFESDSEKLKQMIDEDKEVGGVIRKIEGLKRTADGIIHTPSVVAVDAFLVEVNALDKEIIALNIAAEKKNELRLFICVIAREVAITLHNDQINTELALTIANSLESEFGLVPEIGAKLREDVSVLHNQKIMKDIQKQDRRKRIIKYIIIIVMVVPFLAYSCSSTGDSSDSSNESNSSIESSSTPDANLSSEDKEVVFSQSVSSYENVYVDIVSIEPTYGIGTTQTYNSSVCCKCETSWGETVWVYMSVYEYNEYIDSSADIDTSYGDFETVTYSQPQRVHGIAREADSLCEGLGNKADTMVLQFDFID